MNFLEAINSKKPFRGKADPSYSYHDVKDFIDVWSGSSVSEFMKEINGEFTVEEITITKERMYQILNLTTLVGSAKDRVIRQMGF